MNTEINPKSMKGMISAKGILNAVIGQGAVIINDWMIYQEAIEGGNRVIFKRGTEVQQIDIPDGFSPTIDIDETSEAITITITDVTGTKTIKIPTSGSGTGSETDPTVPQWAKQPQKPTYRKDEVGLGAVENVRQYSEKNPPPYPVMSVNGKTGAVELSAKDVGAQPAGDYLLRSELPDVPTKLSELEQDSNNRLTTDAEKAAWNKKSNFSGAYADLTGKPDIPTVPKNVSAFSNDAGYLTKVPGEYVTDEELNAKGYLTQHQDLSAYAKKSEIPNVSAFITRTVNDLENYYLKSQVYTRDEVNQKVSAIPKFTIEVVSALPSTGISETTVYLLATGSGSDLYTEYINVNGTWEVLGSQRVDLTGYATQTWTLEQFAGYQPKGNYALKSELPTVPTNVSAFQNDAGYAKKTEIPTVPTNVSAFTNDAKYAKQSELPTALSQLSGDASHRVVTDSEKAAWNAKSNFSGAYADLTGKPTIPTVPTKVSAFENDKGYLTQHQDISGKLDANKLPEAIVDALGYTPADAAAVELITDYVHITPGTNGEKAENIRNDASAEWVDGLYVNYQTGATSQHASYAGSEHYFELPEDGRVFARFKNNNLYYPTIAFYDDARAYLNGEYPVLSSTGERDEYNGMYGVFYTVPTGAKYFRISYAVTTATNLEIYLIYPAKIGGSVEIPGLAIPRSAIDGKTVVCFGDSLFGMYRGGDSAPAFIAKETGAKVYNVGFGGCRMSVHPTSGYAAFSMWALAKAITENNWSTQDAQASSGSAYFPEQLALLKSIDFGSVDIAVIHYGTNDFGAGTAVQIDNASDPDDYNTLCGALRYSVEKLLGAYPKLRIYVSLPVYRFWVNNGVNTYAETYLNKGGKTLPEFVEALRNTAAEYNLPVIDSYYGLGINKTNASTFLEDGTHHNATGRERFGRYIGANMTAQQTSGKSGVDMTAVQALIDNAIGAAIGGAY